MRLARRLILVVAMAVVVLLAVDGYIGIRDEQSFLEVDSQRDGRLMGRTLAAAMAGSPEGRSESLEVVDPGERAVIHVVSFDPSNTAYRRPRAPLEILNRLTWGNDTAQWADEAASDRLYTYVLLPHRPLCALEVIEDLTPARAKIQREVLGTVVRVAGTGLAFLVLVFVVGIRYVGRPLRQLVEMARRIGSGDLSARMAFRHHDELGELADAMNGMCEGLATARAQLVAETHSRVAAVEQLRHADRLATVGQLAAGIAHELGTPLNVVGGRAKMIATGEAVEDEAKESAEIIRDQAQRMTQIVRELLDFSRRRPAEPTLADLREVARETVRILGHVAQKKRVALAMETGDACCARVDVVQIRQALTNLVMNAIQAARAEGHVTVSVIARTASPPADHDGRAGEYSSVEVRDDGPGITNGDRARIFEPFFTTKDVGEGTGLGLAVAHGLVRENGGWIAVESDPGHGASFSIFLPPAATGDEEHA